MNVEGTKATKRIIKCHLVWAKAVDKRRETGQKTKEWVIGEEEKFRSIIEDADATNDKELGSQLRRTQVQWQKWEESRAGATEKRRDAGDKVTAARKALAEAVENANQLDLFS